MGVTIHYRGTFDDLTRVEEFEDRVLDVVSALGGQATIWRSFGQQDPARVVRGLLVQMAPGQDTLSLLISPEGQLLNLFEIKQAEQGPLPDPPDCFVKTQFGSLLGHVAVVSLFDALRAEYFSDLEVEDESGYFRQRDPLELARKLQFIEAAMHELGDALEGSVLSPEAAEDPEILAIRIGRMAELVARRMQAGPDSEREQNRLTSDPSGQSLEEVVRLYSDARREAEMRQERLMRRIEEGRGQGLSTDAALMAALREVLGESAESPEQSEDDGDSPPEVDSDTWLASVQTDIQLWLSEKDEETSGEKDWSDSEPWSPAEPFLEMDSILGERPERHPALLAAEALYLRLTELGSEENSGNGFRLTTLNGVGELLGGLAQATGKVARSRQERAAVIVQLKRALKGLAFCRGGVFGLRSAGRIDDQVFREIREQLQAILKQLHELLTDAWNES